MFEGGVEVVYIKQEQKSAPPESSTILQNPQLTVVGGIVVAPLVEENGISWKSSTEQHKRKEKERSASFEGRGEIEKEGKQTSNSSAKACTFRWR